MLCAALGVACSGDPGPSARGHVDTAHSLEALPLQTTSVICGDGVRDPLTEECDDGLGSESDLCSSRCQVTDALAAVGAQPAVARKLGEGRHPIAGSPGGFGVVFVEPDPLEPIPNVTPPLVGLAVFDGGGDPRARIPVSEGGTPTLSANPVVAALPGAPASYAVAWTDFNGDGDELGIALRRVSVSTPDVNKLPVLGATAGATLGSIQFANSGTDFSQYDPDLLWVGSSLVVAWTDATDVGTAPDVRFRTFSIGDSGFTALGDDQTLSATAAFESNVALAPFGSSWAAAWRASALDGQESIEVTDTGSGNHWSVGPHLPADSADHPALADAGGGRILLLYTDATDPGNTGTANVGRLRAALLGPAASAVVDVPLSATVLSDPNVSLSAPSLVQAGTSWYMAWRSAAQPGNAAGDELWLRRVSAIGATSLTLDAEQRLPRWPTGTPGDQRFPALFAAPPLTGTPALPDPTPSGALLLAWEDYGKNAGTSEGDPDVLVELAPLPIVRFATQPRTDCSSAPPCAKGEGNCASNAQCQTGLVCQAGAGPKFGLGPDISVCEPAHCANNVLDGGETAVDCGGPDCGKCLCGDGITLTLVGEECDDGNTSNSDACLNTCKAAKCGDGITEIGVEACDDKVQTANCEATCSKPVCGDHIVNTLAGETCEDGNTDNTDACVACHKAACGDGFTELGVEACDDKVQTANCEANCTKPLCGDAIPNALAGEQCDDGNNINTDGCVAGCKSPTCGDHFIWAGHETCDDGNNVNTDACVACHAAACGDGFTELGVEACDDKVQTANCEATCTKPRCGDGIPNKLAGEQCDDGNSINTDDCVAGCKTPICGDHFIWAGHEACDDGNNINTDDCVACHAPFCGDGFKHAGVEFCDSGGIATAICDPDCTAPVCGDGFVNAAAGELCEPSLTPGCSADCKTLPACTNGASCLAVQHIANGPTGDNQVQPYFQIVNNGAQSVSLNQLKIRYFFTRVDDANASSATCQSEPAPLNTFCDFAQMGCTSVTRTITAVSPWLKGVDTYFDVAFTGTQVLAPGQSSGPIQLRISRSDFVNFVETDDYSFKTGTTFAFNTKVALYKSGTLVWGTEPKAPLVCGDGVVDHCEACDTTHESATCNANCSLARCGDGIRNATRGEACDTGGATATCDADCTAVVCGDGVVNPAAGEVCEPSLAQGCLATCKGFNGTVGCTNGGTCLKVQNLATDSATDNQIFPHLKLINNGGAPIPLSELSVRYWFTNDGSAALQSFCDFASFSSTNSGSDCAAITRAFVTVNPARPNADRYFEVRFTSTAVLQPGASTGELQLRFSKVDFSNFNENNDYSHRISSTYQDSTKIGVYRNNVLIWGTPP